MTNTKIEWTEVTWNPVTGCTKISEGCQNCYAEKMAFRLAGRYGYPKKCPFKVTLHPNRLNQPLFYKKKSMIFVCSMGDLFHSEVPDNYIEKVINIIKRTPNHVYQILTKRVDRLNEFTKYIDKWPNNVWLGTTIESNKYLYRIKYLTELKCSIKFISCEPLLSDLKGININNLDWVIVGGESGPKARPIMKDWVIYIRDNCIENKIPFFFKQWGGVNKKKTGRKLEGKEWNQYPI